MGGSKATVSRDVNQATMFYFRSCYIKSFVDDLFSYILYNAKYKP